LSGYNQDASPNFPNTTPNSATLRPKILNVLIDMKKNNKSDYTINFTRKALSYLGKHTSLEEPEAVKMLIADAGYILSTKLTLSMETGLRPVELCGLRVKDLDLDHKTVKDKTLPQPTNLNIISPP